MNRLRQISLYCSIAAFLTAVLLSCGNPMSVVQQLASDDTTSSIMAKDIEFIRSDSGNVQLILSAPQLLKHKLDTGELEFPQGFNAVMFTNTHDTLTFIRADYGISSNNMTVIEAEGNVEVHNYNSDDKMNSEKLYWNQKTKQIFTRSAVKITMPDKEIFGDSLAALDDFSEYTIYNGRATLEIEEEGL